MSLRERLENGEILGPEDGTPKTSITSTVSQLRKLGYEIETLGGCRYRMLNGDAADEAVDVDLTDPTNGGRPPIPGESLVLDLTVTELRLEGDKLMVKATDGVHPVEFPW